MFSTCEVHVVSHSEQMLHRNGSQAPRMDSQRLRQDADFRLGVVSCQRHQGQQLRPGTDVRRNYATSNIKRWLLLGASVGIGQQSVANADLYDGARHNWQGGARRRREQHELGFLLLPAHRVRVDADHVAVLRIPQSAHEKRATAHSGESFSFIVYLLLSPSLSIILLNVLSHLTGMAADGTMWGTNNYIWWFL